MVGREEGEGVGVDMEGEGWGVDREKGGEGWGVDRDGEGGGVERVGKGITRRGGGADEERHPSFPHCSNDLHYPSSVVSNLPAPSTLPRHSHFFLYASISRQFSQ